MGCVVSVTSVASVIVYSKTLLIVPRLGFSCARYRDTLLEIKAVLLCDELSWYDCVWWGLGWGL